MEQLFVNKPTGKQPKYNGSFYPSNDASGGTHALKSLMDNEWEAADPMDFGKRKKMMDEYCAKDDDERDTAITQL